jgi:hypothetical protein
VTYAFVEDVPADAAMYAQITAEIKTRLATSAPEGLIAHIAFERPGGMRYVDVWENQAAWERFREDVAEPAVTAVLASYGLPHDESLVTSEEINVVEAWIGERAAV